MLTIVSTRLPFSSKAVITTLILVTLAIGGQAVSRVVHAHRVKAASSPSRSERKRDRTTQRLGTNQDVPESLAAAGDLDTSFNPGVGATVAGTINAEAIQSDGKILIGGAFTSYNGMYCNGLARINSDGSPDPTFNSQNSGIVARRTIFAVAIQSDGKIVVGGDFTSYNGVTRNRIARLNSDGSLDTSFDPTSAFLNDSVFALAIQSDGKILAGGNFSNQSRIARFNTDGSLDSPFHPAASGGPVYAIAVQADGKIVLGGSFTNVANGSPARVYVARVNSDGSLDSLFHPNSAPTANGGVRAIAIQSDGKIVLGGLMKLSNTSILARLNSNGTLDSEFLSGANFVFAVAIQSDGKILVTGSFNLLFIGSGGPTRNGILRLNSDGSLDTSFDPGAGLNNGTGQALSVQSDGKILIGGSVTTYGAATANEIVRVNTNGSLDNSFNSGGGANATGTVYAIAVQADGKIILGGAFTAYNGVARRGIARVNSDGSLDTSFDPGTGVEGGTVFALAVQADGKIVLTGQFGVYNGVSRGNIARVNVDGGLDSTFNPGTGPNLGALAIAIQADGRIIVVGQSSSYNGVSRNGIARVNSDGGLDPTFDPGTGAANGITGQLITSVAVQVDGQILISGALSSYNGVGRKGIARINSNGSLDTSFDPGTGPVITFNSLSNTLQTYVQIQTDGKILLAGNFSSFNGVNRGGVARLNNNGSLDSSFDSGKGSELGFDEPGSGTINALAVQSDGQILIGGLFFFYNDSPLSDIARLNTDGSLDTSFNSGSGANNTVNSLAVQPDGKILLGGQFSTYNNVNRGAIARVSKGNATTVQFSAPNYNVNEGGVSATVTVTRTGDTSGASTVDLATSDGSALQSQDYNLANGTLSFAVGETSKTFVVLIIDDGFVENAETLNVTLSNSIGAVVASPKTATVTISDNDTAGSISPAPKRFGSSLGGGQETPPNNPPATTARGYGLVLLNGAETSAQVGLQFQNLSSAQTAAHIHGAAAPGIAAPILFPLPTTNPVINFAISPTAQNVADLKAGLHYQNVHSVNFPNGEIRGQLFWNPTLEENFFVRQQYLDFLSRDPDPGGFNFWVSSITPCGADTQCFHDRTIGVSDAFFFEPEFQQTAGFVFRAYRAAFGNNQPLPNPDTSNITEANKLVDYATFVADRARVVGGVNLSAAQLAFANLFVSRPTFTFTYPLSLNTGTLFVNAVLATIQTADNVDLTSQRTTLINQYNNAGGGTAGRAQVMYLLSLDDAQNNAINNQAFIDAEYNRQFAVTLYFGYLRRNPEIPGFIFWRDQINSAPVRDVAKQNALVCSFITAAEYQFRFGPSAPRTNGECPQ